MWSKILVPLDGSVEAAAAVPLARVLANEMHAEIVLVRVVKHDDERPDANAYLDQVAASLTGSCLRAHTLVAAGSTAQAIVEQARLCAAQLIAISTHGRGGAARAVRGSVTSAVLAQTTLPVVITQS